MSAPSWQRYPKIAESSGGSSSTNERWVVTEKLHGANFSVVARPDGATAFASRSGLLAEGDNFFGYRSQGLHAHLSARVHALRESLVANGTASVEAAVTVYGELCGGSYPHADVPACAGALPVQQGVWYSPQLVFVGFDVLVHEDAPARFLPFELAAERAVAAGLRFAQPLHTGDLPSCLAFEVRFATRLPAALGLPPVEANWAEGVVVRPLGEPAASGSTARRLFKRKIPEFSEKQYGHERWRDARCGGGGGAGAGADAEALLRYEMLAAINAQRLASVASKRGPVDPVDKPACRTLLRELIEDVEASLNDEGLLEHCRGDLRGWYPALARELDDEARKVVTKHLRGLQAQGQASV